MSTERSLLMNLQSARLAAAGKVFVLSASADEPIATQAPRLFEGVSHAIEQMGGWQIEDRALGTRPKAFAGLMERRQAGELSWESVCPWPDSGGRRRSRLELKLPYNMLSRAGYPCWALDRRVYSIDLFNPTNELMLPYENEGLRLWQLIPWPPRFSPETEAARVPALVSLRQFRNIIEAAAVAIDAEGFGGRIQEVVSCAAFPELVQHSVPLPAGLRLSDLSFLYMVLRRSNALDGALARIREDLPVALQHGLRRVALCDSFGPDGRYVFIGIEDTRESFPEGPDLLAVTVGELIGRPYALRVLMSEL